MRGMGNMGNMQGMMKQMKKLQQEMATAQDELSKTEFTASSASDMVKVTMTGDHRMADIQINPAAIDPDDPDMLQDLIIEATNAALKQVDDTTEQKMGKYTRGLPM